MRAKLAVLTLVAVAACSPMRDNDIPGIYHAARGVGSETLTLRDDGTYVHAWDLDGDEGQETGSWSIRMMGFGFAHLEIDNYRDRLDPDAPPTPENWATEVNRRAPWDPQRIRINSQLALNYEKVAANVGE